MRPLFYDYPDEPKAWEIDDQYMFGPEYLVAPILHEGARQRTVYFPGAGEQLQWRHHFTGAMHAAGTSATVLAPLEQFPLFVRTLAAK